MAAAAQTPRGVAARRSAAGLTAAGMATAATSVGVAFAQMGAIGGSVSAPSLRASVHAESQVEVFQEQPASVAGIGATASSAAKIGITAAAAAGVAAGRVRRRGRGEISRQAAPETETKEQQEATQSSSSVSSANSVAVPFLAVPQGLTNNPMNTAYPGDYGFDPLGFAGANSPLREFDEYMGEVCRNFGVGEFAKLRWYREAELMHGRVCMLAVFNILIRETGNVIPVEIEGQVFGFLPDQAIEANPDSFLQFLSAMVFLEVYRGGRLLIDTSALAGDLGLGMGPGDALAKEMTVEELAVKQVRELQNGRLAMVGFIGMVAQYYQYGNFIIQEDQVLQLQQTLEATAVSDVALIKDYITPFLTVLLSVLAIDGSRRLGMTDNQLAKKLAGNSIASKAINPGTIAFDNQDPGVPLPAGVVAGQAPQPYPISEEQVVEFEEDGVIILRGALKGWVPFLTACTNFQIENPHVWSLVGRMSGLYDYIQRNMWMTNDGFRDFLYYSPLGTALAKLGRTEEVRVSTDMLLVNPNKGFGWHQDNQNGPIDFPDAMRWWVAMDKCGENDFGAPEYICGSHTNGTVSNEAVFVDRDSGDLGGYTKTKKFVCEPGDLIIWDARCIHRILAPPGQFWEEGTQRRAFGGTVAKSGAIYLNKGGASGISDLAGHSQISGEPLGGAYFPRIYPNRVEDEEEMRNRGEIVGRSPQKMADLAVTLASNASKYVSFTKVVGKKN